MSEKIRVLLSEEEVEARIRQIAAKISKDYAGKEIHLICVLKGGVFFTCELAKRITVPVSLDFMSVSSYGDDTKSSGVVRIVKDLDQPLAPSDTAVKFVEFLEECRKDWGFARESFIDCADAATITELRKYKRLNGCLYNFVESYKKVEILDRIKLQLGWIQQGCYLVVDTCTNHISEMEKYSWDEDKDIPEDRNDHTINSQQYGWIPYRDLIGFEEEQKR